MNELGQMVNELIFDTKEEIKTQLPKIDLSLPLDDGKIKQAILDMSPTGWQKLFSHYGQEEVMKFVSEFSQRRRF